MPRQVKLAAKDPQVLKEAALRNRTRRIVGAESEFSSEEDGPDCIEAEAGESYCDSDSDSDSDSDVGGGSDGLTDRAELSAGKRRVQSTVGGASVSPGSKSRRLDDIFTEAHAYNILRVATDREPRAKNPHQAQSHSSIV